MQIDKCFGFDTAVEESQRALLAAKVEASSAYRGIGLVKLMGRQSGFIAMQAGLSALLQHAYLHCFRHLSPELGRQRSSQQSGYHCLFVKLCLCSDTEKNPSAFTGQEAVHLAQAKLETTPRVTWFDVSDRPSLHTTKPALRRSEACRHRWLRAWWTSASSRR